MEKFKWEYKTSKKQTALREIIQKYKFSLFMLIHFYKKQPKGLWRLQTQF